MKTDILLSVATPDRVIATDYVLKTLLTISYGDVDGDLRAIRNSFGYLLGVVI